MDWITFSLLNVNKQSLARIRPITVLDTYEGATKNFHDEGLFSTTIFGPIGSEQRDTTFGHIDVNVEIISPSVALTLFELKRLYKDVMSGKRYAVWNESTKDFEPAAPGDDGANTGYSFFIKHFNELKPKETESLIRQQSIDVLNKFRDIALSRYVLVMPAGLRDLEVNDGSGQEKEDDINPMYRKLISTAKNIPNLGNKNNPIVDAARWRLQETFCEIYKYLFNYLDGKKGYIRSKWTKRNISNGTRNVISSMDASSPVMDREDEIRPTDTIMGLFQGIKSLLPVAIHAIRTTYLPPVDAGNGSLYLIDKKTLKKKMVTVSPEDYDKYTTDEGIEKLINMFRTPEYRHKSVTVNGDYLALIYNNGKEFKIFYDIDELPEDKLRKHVTPITYTELLYLSGYSRWNDYFTVVTRYPVAGDGSTYSSTIRLTTTARTSMVYEFEDDWTTRKTKPAVDFPDRTVDEFITSMALHPTRLKGLTADFDGDTSSGDSVYTDDALEENRSMKRKVSFWVGNDGELTVDITVDTIERTVFNLLADPD